MNQLTLVAALPQAGGFASRPPAEVVESRERDARDWLVPWAFVESLPTMPIPQNAIDKAMERLRRDIEMQIYGSSESIDLGMVEGTK